MTKPKTDVVIRTIEKSDQLLLYDLLHNGLMGNIDYGKFNIRNVTLVINEYIDKIGIIKFITGNIIFYYFILLFFVFSDSLLPSMKSLITLISLWIFIIHRNIKYSFNSYQGYTKYCINTDYKDPISWIVEGKSHLWAACLNTDKSKVIGSIGLVQYIDENRLPQSVKAVLVEKIIELKRMYVDKDYRNMGIASRLLEHAEDWSRNNGYKQIILSTSAYQREAVNFYKKKGYKLIYKWSNWEYFFLFSQIVYFIKEL